MRKHFSTYLEQVATKNEDIIFITGDLGYNALENLRDKMGDRFINAGVAEQNMISMAAGMASRGFRVICYSIAPFVVYRCLEQIRIDVCFHNLPVYIVGNGGGYGYGIMGSSHHAIEDIACLSGLPNITCYIPSFIDDMNTCIHTMLESGRPSYLRLGLGKPMPAYFEPAHSGPRSAHPHHTALTIFAQGPVINNVLVAIENHPAKDKIDIFAINNMPFTWLSDDMLLSIATCNKVLVVEEHISIGGLGSAVSLLLHEHALPVERFTSLHAEGYPNALYGSQAYHQQQSGLDEGNILRVVSELIG